MAIEIINVSTPDDGLGDKLRTSWIKGNSNFSFIDSVKANIAGQIFTGDIAAPNLLINGEARIGTTSDFGGVLNVGGLLYSSGIVQSDAGFVKTGGLPLQFLMADGSTTTLGSLGVTLGSGTPNYISRWATSSVLTNSQLFDNGTVVSINNGDVHYDKEGFSGQPRFTLGLNIPTAFNINVIDTGSFQIRRSGPTSFGPSIRLGKANGSIASKTTTLNNQEVGTLSFEAYNANFVDTNSSEGFTPVARIVSYSSSNSTLTDVSGFLTFSTAPSGLATIERLRINDTGNILINQSTDNNIDKLQVNGTILSTGFKKVGGLSTQFLKADGSVDTTVYASVSNIKTINGNSLIGVGNVVLNQQSIYDNSSIAPQILTSSSVGAFTLRRGSASDSNNVLEIQNGAGTNTFQITGAGFTLLGGAINNGIDILQVGGSARFNREIKATTQFSTYTSDGLFSGLAAPCTFETPGGRILKIGYLDYGSGQYHPRIGFDTISKWSLGVIGSAGLDFSIGLGNGTTDHLTIKNSGNILISTTTDNTVDKLQVNGSLIATAIKKTGGLATEFLKANGTVDPTSYQPLLISGTNIKTIEGISLLGSGNIDLVKGDVGLGNVDNTSDINKPVSTATQTALNLKVDKTTLINTTSPITGGGDLSTNRTIAIPAATTSVNGYLTSVDWNIFNDKQPALGYTPVNQTRLINTTAPLQGGGNLSADRTLSITQATTSTDGYLSSVNFNIFNNKQPALGFTPENSANKGIANGYASLDSGGKVPAGQLPAYVDDVLEFANLAAFPVTGTTGIIYVAIDTNKTYRWSGSSYIEISPSAVNSVFGRIGAVVAVNGDYDTSLVPDTLNKRYQTDNQKLFNDATSSIQTQLNGKQATLVSGVNIKTINGQTLLGSGDLVISAGTGGVSSVSPITLGTTGTDLSSSVVDPTGNVVITLNVPTVSGSARGVVTSALFNTWNSKQDSLSGTGFVKSTGGVISYDTNTYYLNSNPAGYTSNSGTVTSVGALTIGIAGTNVNSTVVNSTTTPAITLNIPSASSTNRGALTSTDWITFNAKQDALGFTPVNPTRTINTTSPLQGGGDLSANRTLSILQSSSTVSGYLSSTDWNTFNNKQNLLTFTPEDQANKAQPNGYASLDALGKIPTSQLPSLASVDSVFGRTGNVVALLGDYTALKITNTPAGNISSTNVQDALNELDSEKAINANVIHTTGNETKVGNLTVTAIIKSGGTSSQFLKADGTVDSSTYITGETDTLNSVLTRGNTTNIDINSTAAVRGLSFIKSSGTASQFLKADGSVDSNVYLTSFTEVDTLQSVTTRGASTTTSLTAFSFIKSGGTASQFLKANGSIDSNTYLTSYSETDTLQSVTSRGSITTTSIEAFNFIKTGGTSAQFLKANGSIDSNVYLTAEVDTLQLVTNRGATTSNSLTALSFIKSGGTASQFLKADGTIDSNSYALVGDLHNPVTIGTGNGLSLSTQILSLGLSSTSTTGALSSTNWNTFNNKQDLLVSGTNIKTINGTSVLGAGNIVISSNPGTVTSVAALTLGTTGTDLNSSVATSTSTPVITLNVPTASATNRGVITSALYNTFNGKQDALGFTPENIVNKGQPNGYASLDGSGKVPIAQLPGSIMVYKGTYNAATNTPFLVDGVGTAGDAYRCVVAGAGVNSLNFLVGDFAIYNGTVWEKSPGTDSVTSVFGRTGVIVAASADYDTSLVPDTINARYQTDNQKLYNDATSSIQTQLNAKQASLIGTGFVKSAAGVISYDNNTYYLAANPNGYTSNLGTVTNVSALTIGLTGSDINSSVATGTTTPIITLNIPTASTINRGALSSVDWTTFNNKQAQLNGTGFVKVVGTTVSYDNSTYYPASNPSGYTSNAGTVTSVSIVNANGISGSVATATTTPSITLTLGAITPTSTNGVSAATLAFLDATSSVQTQLNSKAANANVIHTSGDEVRTGSLTSGSFIKAGGTSAQFLKADGTSDSNTYLTSFTEVDTLQSVTTRGASTTTSITANSFIKTSGTASQFLKADGTVDSNVYALNSALHNALTIGTANGLSIVGATQVLSLALSNTSTTGSLSSTDWNTFNSKQALLVSGTNIKTVNSVSLLGAGNVAVEPVITIGTTAQYWRGDKTFQTLDKTSVGLANVDNTSDANKPVSVATQAALDLKENLITIGTTAQYWRGDKTFQALNKAAVGLGNVDNTSDANKPISTATQTALDLKADKSITISTTSPLTGGGNLSANRTFAITQSTTSTSGYLSSTDWNTFNSKQPALGFTPENAANKGIAGGYASLDGTGKVPSIQLPSYVDDVLEYANLAAFPVTGETGKLYVALDTNKVYRWSGSLYIQITTGAVDSVFGRNGSVVALNGDYTTALVPDTLDKRYQTDLQKLYNDATSSIQTQINSKQANLGYTPANSLITISTTAPLTGGGNLTANRTIAMPAATTLVDGYLSAINFNTFNSKQPQLSGTGFVKIVGTTISYDNSTYYLASNPNGYTSNTGTVTTVSVVTANGISGSVATAGTTPAITLSLGAITPTSTNGVTAATMAFVDPTSSIQTQLNNKQAILGGTGFVKSTGGVISYDTNTYITAEVDTLNSVLTRGNTTNLDINSTGIIRGVQFIKAGGLATEFLKANGSVDSSVYLSGSGASNYITKYTGTNTVTNSSIFEFNSISIGIGTTTPSFTSVGRQVVDINGSAESMLVFSTAGASKGYLFHGGTNLILSNNTATGYLAFSAGSATERMRIQSSGNILINTISDNGLGDRLQVSGSVYATSGYKTPAGTASQFLKANGSVDSTVYQPLIGITTIGTGLVTYAGVGQPMVPIATNSNTALWLSYTDFKNALGIQSTLTNPVTGTGTVNTLPKFNGTSTLANSNISDTGSLITLNANSRVVGSLTVDTISNSSTNPIIFSTTGTEKMRLTNSGSLCIGTTSDGGHTVNITGGLRSSTYLYSEALYSDNGIQWGNGINLVGDNWDTTYLGGVYLLDNGSSAGTPPTLSGDYSVIVERFYDGRVAQKATHFNTGRIFVREYNGVSDWTGWKEIIIAVDRITTLDFLTQSVDTTTNGGFSTGIQSINYDGYACADLFNNSTSTDSSALLIGSSTNFGIDVSISGTGKGIRVLNAVGATGKPYSYIKSGVGEVYSVDSNGNSIANTFVKSGGTANQFLKADGSTSGNYKSYVALLSQTGTGAPTVTVLENSIGAIVWSRGSTGNYAGTLTGAFTSNKTTCTCTPGSNGVGWANFSRNNDNFVNLLSFSTAGALSDNQLQTATIEIRVYI